MKASRRIIVLALCLAAAYFAFGTRADSAANNTPRAIAAHPVDFYAPVHGGVIRQEFEFGAADGVLLSYVLYRPREDSNGEAVVYLHGIESHVGWFEGPASLMAARGFHVYCLDRRGSGMNRENKNLTSGHMTSFEQLISDINEFLSTIQGRHETIALAGSSWGGKLALAYHLARPGDDRIDGLIMVTPGLSSRVDLGLFAKVGVVTSLLVRPKNHFDVPIPTELFTTNLTNLDLIRRDPLRLHSVSARFYWESLRLDKFIARRMGEGRLPMLLVLAGHDRVIHNEGVLEVLAKGPRGLLEIHRYHDQTHAVQLDAPERLANDMAAWLERM